MRCTTSGSISCGKRRLVRVLLNNVSPCRSTSSMVSSSSSGSVNASNSVVGSRPTRLQQHPCVRRHRQLLLQQEVVQHQRRAMMMMIGGGYSRMLDLGGAPSSRNDRSAAKALNLNKNCRLQAVVFDFNLLTLSMEASAEPQSATSTNQATATTIPLLHSQAIVPDVTRIQQIAGLLKVDLTGRKDKPIENQPFDDDLSLLLDEEMTRNDEQKSKPTPPKLQQQQHAIYQDSANDIRSKYAAKLQRAVGGGVGAVDRVKSEDSDKKGDAAGHFAARARATNLEASNSSGGGGKWMAATGTGQLLGYLHQRSMKLGLAATPVATKQKEQNSEEAQRMDDFQKQLRDKVKFDAVLKQDGSYTANKLVQETLAKLLVDDSGTTPDRCLWVSDRDDCLRAAKEAGLLTARIRPKNARRGNVSAHYTVESVPEVQTIINEINGISFNTVLQQR
jgi:hypothetical protein